MEPEAVDIDTGKIPAGRALDALIADKVTGWK